MTQILHVGRPVVATTLELCNEVLELVQMYVDEPDIVQDPDHPETGEDFDQLRAYLDERPRRCTTLNVELLATFLTDFERYLRQFENTRGALWRTLLKLYVDSKAAIPLDQTGRFSEETWFTYKGTPYCVNRVARVPVS